ncbi:type II toxin-antitoxin system RelE/ParE family toxin [Microlunatus parietis]|uniref:Plasmid stabilization system protein ParE n=1 Tax=Microlunatus parietis TaxID=682979 RepID=A0A7Y9I557_9ACTN|nr:plasmid stabilization system protein ParE [Microlunatus parietis]
MSRPLHYSPEALAQLDELEIYLVERAGPRIADAYLDRLLAYCDRLAEDPIVGHHRDDLLPGLMTRVFEKSRVVCFLQTSSGVHVIAIYGSGQDWEHHLRDSAP